MLNVVAKTMYSFLEGDDVGIFETFKWGIG
jgi:hypothetical protein